MTYDKSEVYEILVFSQSSQTSDDAAVVEKISQSLNDQLDDVCGPRYFVEVFHEPTDKDYVYRSICLRLRRFEGNLETDELGPDEYICGPRSIVIGGGAGGGAVEFFFDDKGWFVSHCVSPSKNPA